MQEMVKFVFDVFVYYPNGETEKLAFPVEVSALDWTLSPWACVRDLMPGIIRTRLADLKPVAEQIDKWSGSCLTPSP